MIYDYFYCQYGLAVAAHSTAVGNHFKCTGRTASSVCTIFSVPPRYYTIIAPKVIRPDSEYHVAASITGVSTPSTIYVELTGTLDSGRIFNISRTAIVEPYSTKILQLDIGETTPGKYTLAARGLSGINFSKSKEIEYVHKSYSVFIQTDRAIYKPGHKVMFRCLILDSRLRPSIVGPAEVYMVTFEKEFEVAEYVLPNFEVTIDSPKHVQFKESKVAATVHARYTYGKPVKGEATITAYPDIFSGVIQPIFQQPVRKVVPIDGKVTVDFDILTELRLTDEYERPIMIDAVVEEELTTRRQNTSVQVTLHKHKYTMELIKSSEYFKPGLKYTAFIKMTYHDGSPVQDTKNPVLIAYGYTYNQSAYSNITRMLDKNGMVQLDFYPPRAKDNISFPLNIEVNDYVEIEVNSTAPLKYISYEVLGRGDILDAGSIYVPDKHTTSFKFLATYVMAPTAHVIVYYVRADGEVIADSLDVELAGVLQNFVNITATPGEVAPGESVNLAISARPNSFVALLGVDQRSILLKSGNDISYKTGVVILTNGYVHENFAIRNTISQDQYITPSDRRDPSKVRTDSGRQVLFYLTVKMCPLWVETVVEGNRIARFLAAMIGWWLPHC
ncbi:hypothetical protein DMN91_010185 [Ooceraea biroi]|uniref:Alpha-2-macroglobulin bait region domain-containing protein n=1 Tax=Ooceraea biroi TaxID=2015173 RepID=A0A3L8DBS0_OOCBI|nr:hypothetical protein DMN91_010185 [Ooceraea biroi]